MENIGKTVFDILKKLGLNQTEAKIYLNLSKTGPKKASEIAKTNRIHRVLIYTQLKNLLQKQMIRLTNTYPKLYTAIPLKQIIDNTLKTKKKNIQNLHSKKTAILSHWNKVIPNNKLTSDSFMVIEGTKYVHSKMKQMLQNTKDTIKIVTPYPGIVQAYNAGIFEIGFYHPLVDKIKFQFIISLEKVNVKWSMINELFNRSKEVSMPAEVHVADLGKNNFPRYFIADNSELLLSLHPAGDSPFADKNDVGLWTDNKILINAFRAYFEGLWANSIDFLEQIETLKK